MPLALKGVLLAVTAGVCWGTMAVFAQYLFTYCRFSAEDLTALRMIGAGCLLLMVAQFLERQNIFSPFKDRRNIRDAFVYGIGVLMIQYTFFVAIHESNAGTAAIMVGFCPLFIIFYYVLFRQRKPSLIEILCLLLALTGVFLIVTKGHFDSLDFSAKGVFWGLASAGFGAFCTIQPRSIIARTGVSFVVGWGMLIGGIIACFFTHPFTMDVDWTIKAIGSYFFIIAFGTVAAFWCFLKSTQFIPPSIASNLGSFEPFTAVLLTILFLGASFNGFELVGACMIIANMIILSWANGKRQQKGNS